jgi:UPF0755 protein
LIKGETYQEKITIPEGWRREQIAQYLNRNNIVNYESFMAASKDKEGMLFPDTYNFDKGVSAIQIVEAMTNRYDEKTKDMGLTQDQLVIASIVEREAKRDEDRSKIAGVIVSRLNQGMKLQMDSTVQYAVDNNNLQSITNNEINTYKFWQPLKIGQTKSVFSSYNTYQATALPPTPIDNPGLKSILAALNPDITGDLYFINTKDGQTYFAKTLDQQNENIQKYLKN